MSIFRRPTDSTSDSSEDEMTPDKGSSNEDPKRAFNTGIAGGEMEGYDDGPNSGSVSTSDLQSDLSFEAGASIDGHRDMMLSSLLEDYFRTRAAEFLNAAHPGKNYTRQSPEVQPLAQQLFRQAGHVLSSNQLISSSSASDSLQDARRQYLSGLDNLAAGGLTPAADLLNPMRDLVIQSSKSPLPPHLASNLRLTFPSPISSHYLSTFEEKRLLGKGAFGKVFECHNPLDQKTYAVKKIRLSPKLTKRFYEGKHEEMEELLREVKALAMLDHVNVVRYHATWIEQPHQPSLFMGDQTTPEPARAITTLPNQHRLLLHDRPFNSSSDDEPSFSAGSGQSESYGGIVFGEDTPSPPPDKDRQKSQELGPQWSEHSNSGQEVSETLSSDGTTSAVFTDGQGFPRSRDLDNTADILNDAQVLYIQMSMYPMTLAEYLSPPSTRIITPRHCYHLLPALQLLLAILAGLQYIHANGLIHRDIKPGNIFLSDPKAVFHSGYSDVSCPSCELPDGRAPNRCWLNPRIGDFGLVTQLAGKGLVADDESQPHKSGADAHRPVGTAHYRPPVWQDGPGPNDEKVDIFALGVVFTEMLWRCGTAMERANMLEDLQKGILPSGLRHKLETEGLETALVGDVIALATAMVDPNPGRRWAGGQVKKTIDGLLERISPGPR